MRLTKSQDAALRTAHANPNKVAAWLRGEKNLLTINGNVECSLVKLGLIEASVIGRGSRKVAGKVCTYDVTVWELTTAGREALGIEPEPVQGGYGVMRTKLRLG